MNKTKDHKLKELLEGSREVYHTQDLAVLWGVSNPNTLYTTIKRYIERGFLHKIYKGFYSTVPLNAINPYKLGMVALHEYGYVSTETILAESGIITQDIKYITMVSGTSRRFEIKDYKFLVRKMKGDYLLNKTGLILNGRTRKATTERAVADMLYFNPNYYFDRKDFINWKKVKEIQETIGY